MAATAMIGVNSSSIAIASQNRCKELITLLHDDSFFDASTIGKALAMIGLSLCIITGNLLVILAVIVSRRLRTVTNFFIASLAVSDFVIGISVLPFSFTQDLLGFWTFGYPWCRIWLALDVWISTASIYNLVIIALDRYIAVTRPLSYPLLVTPKKAAAAVFGAWMWSFLVSFPPMVSFQNHSADTESSKVSSLVNVDQSIDDSQTSLVDCQCTALDNSSYYIVFSASSSFYVPFVTLLYIYVKIYLKIRRATAAVDKGYMTLKKKHLLPENASKEEASSNAQNQSNIDHLSRSSSAPTPVSKGIWKMRLKKCKTTSESHQNSTDRLSKLNLASSNVPHMETFALRVHRGRYNAAGADLKSTKSSPAVRRVKLSPRLSLDMDDEEMNKKEAAQGDRRMNAFVRRASQKKRQAMTAELESPQSVISENISSHKATVRQRLHERYNKKLKREVRAAKTVALVTGCFFVCWSGFCIIYTMKALPICQVQDETGENESDCVPGWAFAMVLWMGYTNSALNPLIYAVCNRQFRLTFKRILCMCICMRSNGRNSNAQCGHCLRKRGSRKTKLTAEHYQRQYLTCSTVANANQNRSLSKSISDCEQ